MPELNIKGPDLRTNAQKCRLAIQHLRDARDLLKAAGASRTVERVRLAITSAGGAERHASRMALFNGEKQSSRCIKCGTDLDSPSAAGAEDGVCGGCIEDMAEEMRDRVAARIPADFPVQPCSEDDSKYAVTCGDCQLTWDNAGPTAYTPTPSGRCPFEAFHDDEEE